MNTPTASPTAERPRVPGAARSVPEVLRARLGNGRGGRSRRRAAGGGLTPRRERWLKVLGVVLFFGVWEAVPHLFRMNQLVLPPPSVIARTLRDEIAAGEVGDHVLVSAMEYGLALALACTVGITVGVVAGRVRLFDSALEPFVWFLYATPLTAIYPLLILWVGLGFNSVLLIAFLLAAVPVVINTTVGVKNADASLVRVGRAFMVNRWQLLVKIILPGSLPIILAGVRLAVGRALTGVVIGEMFGANAGLGFRIAESAARIRVPEVFAYLLVVVVFGVVVSQAFGVVESRLLRYQPRNR
jgi:NitT/TauT family transport system permease protein